MSGVGKRIFRFGVFEVDATSGELRKAGVRVRLQEQPFQVLMLLLERSGEVVTREEIQRRLWSSDTFVDFDHSLNTVINKIREALSDSATNPRFVETLAKRGYRFLITVDSSANQPGDQAERATDTATASPQQSSTLFPFRLTSAEELPSASRTYVRLLFFLIQIMYLSFYIVALGRLAAIDDLLASTFSGHPLAIILVIVSGGIGIPIRLYLLSGMAFEVNDLSRKLLKLFPGLLVLDELWALSPFLLTRQIGIGLALAMTAALVYVPFAQRALVLMQERSSASS